MIRPFKVVYASGPTLAQTVKIKLDTGTPVISGWNIWQDGAANTTPFLNSLGVSTGFLLANIPNGVSFQLATYSATLGDPEFPDAVLNRLVYTSPNESKQMKLTGLNNAKTYSLTFASYASDADPADNTDIIVQGVTKFAAVSSPIVYKTIFTGVVPIGGEISVTIQGSPYTTKYGCVDGFILKEYN